MYDRSPSDRALRIGLIVLLIALGLLSFDRARRARYDFHHFYLDAHYVWQHGQLNPDFDNPDPDARRQLPFYLPVVPLAIAPLTAFGHVPAALIWTVLQMAALGYSLGVLRRWARVRDPLVPPAAPMIIATLLAVPALLEAARFNQLSFFVLALLLAAFSALDRERPLTAGLMLGLAAVLKLLPLIFLPWLLLKRRWSAAVAMIAAALIFGTLPAMAVFGPRQTRVYFGQWWEHNMHGETARGMLDPDLAEHFLDRRNQSIPQVIARLTWAEHPYRAPWQPLHLSKSAGQWLSATVTLLLALSLVAATWRPWRALLPHQRSAEAALYAIGMLVFAPLLRQYYIVWAIPALVLLARSAANPRSPQVRRLGWAGLGIWAAGMLAWVWPITRVYGTHLLMLIVLSLVLFRATRATPRASSVRLWG